MSCWRAGAKAGRAVFVRFHGQLRQRTEEGRALGRGAAGHFSALVTYKAVGYFVMKDRRHQRGLAVVEVFEQGIGGRRASSVKCQASAVCASRT